MDYHCLLSLTLRVVSDGGFLITIHNMTVVAMDNAYLYTYMSQFDKIRVCNELPEVTTGGLSFHDDLKEALTM